MRSRHPRIEIVGQARAWLVVVLSALSIVAVAPSASGQGAEAVTWARANNCASIRAYLSQYPSGRYVSEARAALRAKSCPDPEAEARRRAEREATERARLENETRDLRDRLAREEAARRAAETRAADEARKRVAAETAAKQKTPAPTTATQTSTYDLNLLNLEVRRAAESARAAQSRAESAAVRARSAARSARASGVITPQSGLGSYTASSGDRYDGNFSGGKRSGAGVYTFDASKPSTSYEGEYLNDQNSGPGVFTWRSGQRFSGDNQAGIASGYGVMAYSDGQRYEGAWSGDKRNGYGVLWTTSGRVNMQGYWTDGTLTTSLTR